MKSTIRCEVGGYMVLGIEKGMRSRKYSEAARKMNIPYVLIDYTKNNAIEKIRKVDSFI